MPSVKQDLALLQDEHKGFLTELLNAVQDIFYVYDLDGNLLFYNDRVEEVTGYSPSELQSMQPWDFVVEADRDRVIDEIAHVVENEQEVQLDTRYLTAAGKSVPYEFTGSPLYDSEGNVVGFAGVGRDISDRKEREQELERNREFLKQTQTVAEIGSWEIDLRTETLRWTDQVYNIHGVDPDTDVSIEDAIEFYHPQDQDTIRTAHERLTTEGEPYDLELRITRTDGETRWVRALGEPWYKDGDLLGARGTFQDITDRKQRELSVKEQRNNLEVLDQMVRHDIRNDLQVITGYTEALKAHVDETQQEYIGRILSSVDTAVELTKAARDLAEVMLQTGEKQESLRLKPVLEAQLDEIRTANDDVALTVEGQIPDTHILADSMLSSVFRNLLKNAVQHNDKEVPEIVVSATEQSGTVVVHIADNGPGVPESRKDDIFGKGEMGLESEGTGIGLYLVKTLVENYGGEVWVEDNEPTGAVFTVELLSPTER
ncbi:PAS domain S-box protein [Halorientalis brevis]|uniref:histidine kinase n=1 Tax=Halorientalis brevis TaxID=1126241 RepID=A0ABD6CFH2_9EURY|nr:HAMP domain-containing sensor histidine kinase [Halorientalis brevis]